MRVMILGAKGQLGRELAARYHQRAHVLPLDLPALDIGDPVQVREAFDNFPPDLVVNAAAYTDVDGAEANREAAFRVNVTGAFNAAAEAERVGARLVYYSTDFVFDGQSPDSLAEEEAVGPESPLGIYGFTKYLGELATRRASRHLILRTAWLYGPGGNNFVEKILAAAACQHQVDQRFRTRGAPGLDEHRDVLAGLERACIEEVRPRGPRLDRPHMRRGGLRHGYDSLRRDTEALHRLAPHRFRRRGAGREFAAIAGASPQASRAVGRSVAGAADPDSVRLLPSPDAGRLPSGFRQGARSAGAAGRVSGSDPRRAIESAGRESAQWAPGRAGHAAS